MDGFGGYDLPVFWHGDCVFYVLFGENSSEEWGWCEGGGVWVCWEDDYEEEVLAEALS